MNQATAKRLLREGAVFLFLDVPEGTEFGIDMKSWNTCEKFRGVKMIPPGIHYIFYSAVNDYGDIAPRSGFFYNFKQGEMIAKKWDKDECDMSVDIITENEIVGFKENLMALDQFLGPYPYDISEKWSNLSSHITEMTIQRIQPLSGVIRSALELISYENSVRSKQNKTDESPSSSKHAKRSRFSGDEKFLDNLLPDLRPKPGTELRFTELPSKHYPENSTPSEITQHNLDLTYTLECLLQNYDSEMDLIGELELSYICFLVGHSFEAFEHWKIIIGLLCECENAISKHRNIYDAFISVLEIQINEVPEEFLADIVSNNNFVYVKLRSLFRSINECNVDGRLKTKVERFKRRLTDKFGWDFSHLDSEDEEDAPVIVET
ncbi:a1 cistron splicing factor aar2-related [Holotrichia oblita]|uniref:A1 cistron splicing factor aar2-related n=1 Tax=Holotrichia oblita TaxID=644536 RepID=A0ACB9SZQ9_HOLOL|nr:a1 cistron splicing factor aar2-related [Holotrichia oblita]